MFSYAMTRGVESRSSKQPEQIEYARAAHLHFDGSTTFCTPGASSITWLDLDAVEQKYLLAVSSDSSIFAFDCVIHHTHGGARQERVPRFHIKRHQPDAHKHCITGGVWYPIDTGMFVTCAWDNTSANVRVWDSNQLEVVTRFSLPSEVYSVHMSHVASAHSLIAAGSRDPQVRLCDPLSGTFSHTLIGHRSSVRSVRWTAGQEFQLLTGGADGQLRLWDIRTSACMRVLDSNQTQPLPSPTVEQPRSRGVKPGHLPPISSINPPFSSAPDLRPDSVAATAHGGAINDVCVSRDGLHWISSGTDNVVRRWDAARHHNTLVSYPQAYNSSVRARRMDVDATSRVLYLPSGSAIIVYDLGSGQQLQLLRGHLETINCCVFNPATGHLFSGGNDNSIVAWTADEGSGDEQAEAAAAETAPAAALADEDAWSDEDRA